MRRLGYPSARQNAAVKGAQRGEADSLTAADCCATHDKYGGNWNMKNQYSRMDNICPKGPKKLRIPDRIDLYIEDGTVYHVRSFFAGDLMMGDVLDALTMEKLERAQ